MISPISHAFPPPGYGPWERVTHDLTERLVSMGHDVTLFAPAGSITSATLIDTVPAPLDSSSADPRLEEELHIAMAMEAAGDGSFDIVHSHLHVHGLVFSRMISTPVVTTLHGVAWDPATHPLLLRYADMPFVSLSDSERSFLPELSYVATIPNGIRTGEIRVGPGAGGYLVFAGRMSPEKGPDLAIEAALNAGVPLRLAGVVEGRHREFFEQTMRRARSRDVEYLGPLDRQELWQLLGEARALVMPLRWQEPFGLVVVESLAAGTPVIAWRMGAMPEILEDGVTGFLVDDVAAAVHSIGRIGEIKRVSCRMVAEARFSDTAMARAYAELYAGLAAKTSPSTPGRPGPTPP
jgi:glycosyltransferase involved in cell wall biosynthesis